MTDDAAGRPQNVRTDPQLNSGYVDDIATGPANVRGHDGVAGDQETDPDRRDLRAEIGKYVSLVPFPATVEQLTEKAVASRAPDEVLERLGGIAPGTSFENTRELWISLDLEVRDRF